MARIIHTEAEHHEALAALHGLMEIDLPWGRSGDGT
jgi:hypothetical protein